MTAMPEVATIELLLADSDITDVVGTRVSTDLITGGAALRVTLAGDLDPTGLWDQQPMLQIECWADDQIVAGDLAAIVRKKWTTYRKTPVTNGYVSGAWIVQGPVWMPDPVTEKPRYLVTVALHLHEPQE